MADKTIFNFRFLGNLNSCDHTFCPFYNVRFLFMGAAMFVYIFRVIHVAMGRLIGLQTTKRQGA